MSTASVSVSATETTNNVVVPTLDENSVSLTQTGGKAFKKVTATQLRRRPRRLPRKRPRRPRRLSQEGN